MPMQWAQWGLDRLNATIPAGSTALLGMNEPNHQEQAAMTPEQAAALWPLLEAAAATHGGLRLGSPSAAPCGAGCIVANPLEWLRQFFDV